ncbi:EamA family transporter RarD [Enterobacterales bacterium AW_CKDN230030176-1A_HGKHYDSX7]
MRFGVLLCVLACALFGALYYFTTLLAPLQGQQIFGWRMLLTVPCVTAFLMFSGEWSQVRAILSQVRRAPWLIVVMLATSALLGAQLFLFLWAPLNGAAMSVSLGYFLMPLTMLVASHFIWRERLSSWQRLAALIAAVGAGHEAIASASFSWETALVALGYPLYFVIRRLFGTDHIGGMWFDMTLLLPVAGYFAVLDQDSLRAVIHTPDLWYLLPALAVLSAAAFICYLSAARRLPLGLFGLLGYVEPVLMVGVALLLGESLAADQYWTYGPIWLAVSVLVAEGAMTLLRERRSRQSSLPTSLATE